MPPSRMDRLAERFGKSPRGVTVPPHRPGEEENVGLTTGEAKPRRGLWICLAVSFAILMGIIGVVIGVVVARWKGEQADEWVQMVPFVALPDPSINFMVVGSWGWNGKFNQSVNAQGMAVVASTLHPEFIISTGDNFWPGGLHNVSDVNFTRSFTQVYSDPSLQVQWHAILGDIDYSGDYSVVQSANLSTRDARWHCEANFRRKFKVCSRAHTGECDYSVEFFFMDTTPIIHGYYEGTEEVKVNFTGMAEYRDEVNAALNAMRDGLASSDATWKIVVGHHPVYSSGEYGDTPDLEMFLSMWFKSLKVDLYINGHDRNLELLQGPDMDTFFVTSGAGALTSKKRTQSSADSFYYYGSQGFVTASVDGPTMDLRFYNSTAHLLYNTTLAKV